MVALAATDWTQSIEDLYIENKKRHARVKLTLGGVGSFYPSGNTGIPLPTTLGMKRNIEYVNIIQAPHLAGADAAVWNYVVSDHAIHGYWAEYPTAAGGASHLQPLPTTWSPSDLGADMVMYVEAVGW